MDSFTGDKVSKVQIGVPNARVCAAQFKLDKVNLRRDQGGPGLAAAPSRHQEETYGVGTDAQRRSGFSTARPRSSCVVTKVVGLGSSTKQAPRGDVRCRMHNVAAASAQRDRHLLEVLGDRSRVPGGKVGET